jgi:uncharacterized protein (DUF1501 family)
VVAKRRVVAEGGVSSSKAVNHGLTADRLLHNLTRIDYTGHYAKEYTQQLHEAINMNAIVMQSLAKGDALLVNRNMNWGHIPSLKQVARLIAGRKDRRADRDLFFIGMGGWDMHIQLEKNLFGNFGMIESSLRVFVKEMKDQDLWNNVLLLTSSEFGRRLYMNGRQGTDHGSAGNHFIIGGSVKGGRVYHSYPDHSDYWRGGFWFANPHESYMVPIAKWMGVEDSQMTHVFPNLQRFGNLSILADLF